LGCYSNNKFFSAILYVGKSILEWLWGGFSIGNPTLNRFFIFYSLFFLFFSEGNKRNEFSRNGLNVNGPLTFKNKSFYFKGIKLPNFISLRNCKDISKLLGFSVITKSQYSENKAKVLLNFIQILKENEILNDFIFFFSTEKILHFKDCYILEFCFPLFMHFLSQGLLIELRDHNLIRNDFFIKLEKTLQFTKEEKNELIFFLQKNIDKVEDIIEFWLL